MLLQRPTAPLADDLQRSESRQGVRTWQIDPITEIDPLTWSQWESLAQHSLTAAPFHRPEFVAPALVLEGPAAPLALMGYDAQRRLCAAAVLEAASPTARHPYRWLRTWQTPYTFLDSLLVNQASGGVLDELWPAIREAGWHALVLPQMAVDSPLMNLLQVGAEAGNAHVELGARWTRPVLRRECSGPAALLRALSPRRQKSLRRGWRWLERSGPVDVVVHRRESAMRAATTLLRLEMLGWKGEQRTALASRLPDCSFFLDLVQRLAAQDQVAFLELRVGDEAIASLAMLVHGRRAFTFKIGWDPQWERGCPGFQLMSQLVSLLPSEFPELDQIDSCAATDSFIGHVWPQTRELTSCVISVSRRAKLCSAMRSAARTVLSPRQA